MHQDHTTLELQGEQAAGYAKVVASGLEAGIPAGIEQTVQDDGEFSPVGSPVNSYQLTRNR